MSASFIFLIADYKNVLQSAEGFSALFDPGRNSSSSSSSSSSSASSFEPSFAPWRRLKTTDEEAAAARLAGQNPSIPDLAAAHALLE